MSTKASGAHRVDAPHPVAADTSRPADGDLLLVRETPSSERYGVRQLPGGLQFTAATKEEALTSAQSFAAAKRVNIWSTDGEAVSLLETYR